MKYRKKLLIAFVGAMICTLLVQLGRINMRGNATSSGRMAVVYNDTLENSLNELEMSESKKKALIIASTENEYIAECSKYMMRHLDHMQFDSTMIYEDSIKEKSFNEYDLVIINVIDFNKYSSMYIYDVLEYARSGGNVLFGLIPEEIDGVFVSFYRQLGIQSISNYIEAPGYTFDKDLLPNVEGLILEDSDTLNVNSLNVILDEECNIYLSSLYNTPLYWTRKIDAGNIGFYNAYNLGEKYSSGLFAGVIATLMEDFIYPIINAKTVFIDDFPSPQYNSESEEIYQEYNRTVKEFYRDIWWPDMQKIAKRHNVVYTGLFVSTYNNIVNPEDFVFEDTSMMKYFGRSLLKNDYELGLHGYNHQSLALEGFVPEDMGYNAWNSAEDMQTSIEVLVDLANMLFPNSTFKSYVPPSNYLSPEGREILPKAMPDLEIISGVYVAEGDEANAYLQDFDVAKDGIVEFPRLSSGMWNENHTVHENLAGLGLYGVFSHFIHPDDIISDDRGKNALWSDMSKSFEDLLERTTDRYDELRPLTAYEASIATRVYDALEVASESYEDKMIVNLNGFTGEAYFYLRTSKKPQLRGENYSLTKMSDHYYLVKATGSSFEIRWEE